jgi:hypothetical protein
MFRGRLCASRLLVYFGFLFAAGLALARPAPEGMIIGKVTDSQGNPLAGVTVRAASPALTEKAAAVTDTAGAFRLPPLIPGTYEITLSLPGYQEQTRTIVLQESQTVFVEVAFVLATGEERAGSLALAPLIDVKSAAKTQTLTRDVLLRLPRRRDFESLLDPIPGVQHDDNTGGLSVDGGTGAENRWTLDGADVTDVHTGTKAQGVVVELIDEARTTASGYAAELGGSLGGVISVITRSGENGFHGEISSYYQNNERWMLGKSRDYLRQDPYNDQLYGYFNDDEMLYDGGKDRDRWSRLEGVFSLGGHILKNKLWFFGSFSPASSRTTAQRYFLSDPDPSAQEEFSQEKWDIGGAVKITASPSPNLRLAAAFNSDFSRDRGSIPSIYGTSDPLFPWSRTGLDYPRWNAAGTIDWSLSSSVLTSWRGGWSRQSQANQRLVPQTTVYTFGRSNAGLGPDASLVRYRGWSNWPDGWAEIKKKLYEKAGSSFDLTVFLNLAGEHTLKVGIQYNRLHEEVEETAPYPQVILNWGIPYLGLASGEPVRGEYGYYEVRGSWTSPYGYSWNAASDRWALYLQDSWTIRGRLTINAGLRTESEYIPSFGGNPAAPGYKAKPIEFSFLDKLSPRAGLVWDVLGDARLKIFGSLGIYYDVMKLYLAEAAYGGFQWVSDYYELNTLDWTAIAANGKMEDRASQEAGGRYVGSMHWRLPAWDTTDPRVRPTSQSEISFGAEQKLAENLSLTVRFIRKHLIRTIEDVGLQTPLGEQYTITNPGFGWSRPVSEGGRFPDGYWPTPRAKRDYSGLNIALEKRFNDNWQGGVNYTWSKVVGNYGGLSSTEEGGRNAPNAGRSFDLWFMGYDLQGKAIDGFLPQDRTHSVKIYGSCTLPFGLTIGLVAYGRSGLPLTTRLEADNAYVYPYNSFNLGRLPSTAWADLFLEYTLRFGRTSASLNLQVNNITNTKTWQAKDTVPNRVTMPISDQEILSGSFDYRTRLPECDPNPAFLQFRRQFAPWSARLGARFSF